jgi:hypothetical protein
LAGKVFYAAMAAGAAFVVIGIAASIYTNVPVDVRLDNTLAPGAVDPITPIMNEGNTASITVSGASYEVEIKDPEGIVIATNQGNSTFSYDLTAQKEGEYTITVRNTGNSDVSISGHAQTKASPLGLSGALMLAVTGIVLIGLGLRFRRR